MQLHTKQKADKYLGNLLIAINLIAAKTLGFILQRNHRLEPGPQNILFIKIMGIGSVLMTADAVAAIRKKYPSARLILAGSNAVVKGVQPFQLFDDYFVLNDTGWFAILSSSAKIIFRTWQLSHLWVCNLEVYSKLATIFSLWTMGRNRFDFFFTEVSFRKYINTHPVYFNQFIAARDNYNRMAESMGAQVEEAFIVPAYSKKINTNHADKKYIVVSNTCSELAKERLYPAEALAVLLTKLINKYNCTVLLSGTKEDVQYYDALLQLVPQEYHRYILNKAGNYTIADFIELLYHDCRLLITVDSAPLHFAHLLGTPTVSLWGPTNPATRMQETSIFQAVYLAVNCSPCVHHTDELPCGGNNFCMKNITNEFILTKIEQVFAASSI